MEKEEVKTTTTPQETVTLNKEQFTTLMNRIEYLEHKNTKPKAEPPKYRTARVWFEDEEMKNIVVGYGKSRDVHDVDGTWHLEMEIFYKVDGDGAPKTKWVRITNFRDTAKTIDAKIIETKDVGEKKISGWTKRKEVDYANYRTKTTDDDVALEVYEPIVFHKLELPDGRTIELPANALN